MTLNSPEQELKRDLRGLASDFKWSAVELTRIAERLSPSGNEADAQSVLKMCTVFHAADGRMLVYAEEVSEGRIVRGKDR